MVADLLGRSHGGDGAFGIDDREGAAAARWANQLGLRRAYVLDDRSVYGHVVATAFVTTAKELGLQIVGQKGIDPEASDYAALATKIRDTQAELVYFGGLVDNGASQLFQDIRAAAGPNLSLMGPEGLYDQDLIDAAGQAAEGVYVTTTRVPASKLTGKGADWFAAYKAKYNAEPEAYTPNTYEATGVLLDAIKRAGVKDREAIRAALFATKGYDGIFGKWSFDPNGDPTPAMLSGRQIKNGKFDEPNAVLLTAD